MSLRETESGYVSGSSSNSTLPDIYFTKPHLAFLNRQLQFLEPQGTNSLSHCSLWEFAYTPFQIFFDGASLLFLASSKRLHLASPA